MEFVKLTYHEILITLARKNALKGNSHYRRTTLWENLLYSLDRYLQCAPEIQSTNHSFVVSNFVLQIELIDSDMIIKQAITQHSCT